MSSRAISNSILITLSGLIGFFGLSSIPRLATFILAVPVLWGLASDQKSVFAVMLAYFLAVSRGLLPGAAVFLSDHHTLFQAAALICSCPSASRCRFCFGAQTDGKKPSASPSLF